MSWVDDQAAKFEVAIRNAKARLAYGKHFPARQLAEEIEALRKILLKKYGTLERAVDALSDIDEQNRGIVMLAHSFGISLLKAALINPKAIRLVAEAFGKLEDTGAQDPRGLAIIDAYEHCQSWPPTFGELKRAFIARSGITRWRSSNFSVRKTLAWLGLPLARAKVGRPRGSRSQIGNQRRLEQ